jgi:hypothetical protein
VMKSGGDANLDSGGMVMYRFIQHTGTRKESALDRPGGMHGVQRQPAMEELLCPQDQQTLSG